MKRLAPLVALALLGGCARESARYPSLLPRPVEGRDLSEPAPVPAATAAPDAALDAHVAALVQRNAETARAFDAAALLAEPLAKAAEGAPAGDERWLRAQTALGPLGDSRTRTLATVNELEELSIARATDGQPPYPALDAASKATAAELDRESATIERLNAMLAAA